jgi:hypothetical protein
LTPNGGFNEEKNWAIAIIEKIPWAIAHPELPIKASQ